MDVSSVNSGIPSDAYSGPPQSPFAAESPKRKSATAAFLLSLAMPGLGQLYCGKTKRALLTFLFFSLSLGIAVFLWDEISGDERLAVLWGMGLRMAIVLYGFAFLDSYFTATELSAGTDEHIFPNPRVAAVLNLLTLGFGYWYVGEKKKGVFIFLLVGAANRLAMRLEDPVGMWMAILVEIALAFMAVDAYRIARMEVQSILEVVPGSSRPIQPAAEFPRAVPLALAFVIALGYVAFVAMGLFLPDFSAIDQSQSIVAEETEGTLYRNPKYGIRVLVPPGWEIDRSEPGVFLQAELFDGACHVSFAAQPALPIIPLQSAADCFHSELLEAEPGFRIIDQGVETLFGVDGQRLTFSTIVGDTEVVQRYWIARRGLSIFAMVATFSAATADLCAEDFELMRRDSSLSD